MRTRVTEQGVLIPKNLLKDIDGVEIRQEENLIIVVPIAQDPILQLGEHPITDDIEDASENHDAYVYGK